MAGIRPKSNSDPVRTRRSGRRPAKGPARSAGRYEAARRRRVSDTAERAVSMTMVAADMVCAFGSRSRA
ncbi:hypothetical protein AwMethylo_36540 [Methylobacterium sp.]|nr:hypothetical protein AwMethylo_36540 [Methylobacterium sp.]